MKRRNVLKSLAGLPALAALPAAAQAPAADASVHRTSARGPGETPKLDTTAADAVSTPAAQFFTPAQFATLRRLAVFIVPAANGKPGADEAAVPEFIDFLISRCDNERQTLYRNGLDALDARSRERLHKAFAELDATEATPLLAPLQDRTWAFAGPYDRRRVALDDYGQFLFYVKDDLLRATYNSREWAAANRTRRGAGGIGTYWYALK